MHTYISFLRGINVSGQKKIRMADLKVLLEALDFKNVVTYIQSGNVVFKSAETNIGKLENLVHKAILQSYNFDVPVLIKRRKDLKDIVDQNQFTDSNDLEENKIYFVLLKETPDPNMVGNLQNMKFENEQFIISDNCVYLRCGLGAGKAKCNNNFIENKLKVVATSRNYRTMMRLLELSSN